MTYSIITPTVLIQKRDNAIAEIKDCWKRINAFNVFDNGVQQKFNLHAVYDEIKRLENELILTKIALQAINCGFNILSTFVEMGGNHKTVFTLSQVKERITKLNLINTKKEEGQSVNFTRGFIDAEVGRLDTERLQLEADLDKFNEGRGIKM